ncbi:hypothetical protein DFR72_102819 [Lentzea flaviverrucosa]|nr:hypothetical protein DFR72_102819 [Lentzea flaviverrucosa]
MYATDCKSASALGIEQKKESDAWTSHLVSPFAARTWRAREVLCNTESMRATFFEFFYGTRTPAPVVA